MGHVDIALLAVLLVSVLVGLIRGLVMETLALAGWVVAYFAAHWLAPTIAGHLPLGSPDSLLNHGAAFVLIFVLALIIWSLGARLLSMLVKSSPLSGVDRFLGAGFGLLRGVVLLLVVATVVAFTPWSGSQQWQASRGRIWLGALMDELAPLLPEQWSKRLPVRSQGA
jgi:membrane protein required for colicin V production